MVVLELAGEFVVDALVGICLGAALLVYIRVPSNCEKFIVNIPVGLVGGIYFGLAFSELRVIDDVAEF